MIEVMAKIYRPGRGTRIVNGVFRAMTRLGIGASYRRILSVRGRRSGIIRSTPVDAIEVGSARWLVAGYGPVSWVANVRAAEHVSLSRGGRSASFRAIEAEGSEAVPVLRAYMRQIRVTRPYFDATPDATDAAIAAELAGHAVFRLTLLEPEEVGAT
jgi:deazaflavin-dependent oxidoreductase (nitroreductase family)